MFRANQTAYTTKVISNILDRIGRGKTKSTAVIQQQKPRISSPSKGEISRRRRRRRRLAGATIGGSSSIKTSWF